MIHSAQYQNSHKSLKGMLKCIPYPKTDNVMKSAELVKYLCQSADYSAHYKWVIIAENTGAFISTHKHTM